MHPESLEKRTVAYLKQKKIRKEKIIALTAYDFPTAKILSACGVDLILVGDSLGMVLQGNENTLKVSLNDIIYHTKAVANAKPASLIVADMPYGSYHLSPEQATENALRCIQEGGAEAVKIEGGRKRIKTIQKLLDAEIPVVGHLGLTPQSINLLGGFKVQGKLKEQALEIIKDARTLQEIGVFMLVLESVPWQLAEKIATELTIPVIGIGAGNKVHGQILVFHDLVGLTLSYLPKFVRQYLNLSEQIENAVKKFIADVSKGEFPSLQESYSINIEQFEDFLNENSQND